VDEDQVQQQQQARIQSEVVLTMKMPIAFQLSKRQGTNSGGGSVENSWHASLHYKHIFESPRK
jgi:hypothetical protein